MAEFLLNKLINEEIDVKKFISWLLTENLEVGDHDLEEIPASRIKQIDFVTYFLNFIHEEVPCKESICQTPRKLSTPIHIEQNISTPNSGTENLRKTDLFQMKFSSDPSNISNNANKLLKSCDHFTPKKTEKSFYSSPTKEISYMSPVSPLYDCQNNFTPKDQKLKNSNRISNEKGSSLCLGDFIVNAKSSSKKKRNSTVLENNTEVKKISSRRINPTNVFQTNNSFQKTENSFNFKENTDKQVNLNTNGIDARSVLVEERLKIFSNKEDLLPVVLPKKVVPMYKNEIEPKLVNVSFRKHLDLIIDIYVAILNRRMILNVTSEIYFLISLLLTKQENIEKLNDSFENAKIIEELNLGVDFLEFENQNENVSNLNPKTAKKKHLYNSQIFESVHNIVYFAAKCLETQTYILTCLDKVTLRLLGENVRFREMSNNFCKQLLNIAFKKMERISDILDLETTNTNVCFNADTDNMQNFPDQLHFHAFKKQRDLFYEILRIWESNHMQSEWQFSLNLGGKIRSLFSLSPEPSNFLHLSRLFKDQLLNSCVKNNYKETGLSDNLTKVPLSLTNINSKKLNLLTNRLVTKATSSGINSVPTFSGHQEFYKNFIVVASNHFFNKHLCDCLVHNILQLNDSKILSCDMDQEDLQIDVNTRKSYVECIKNLRMLAKFLGFIESLPYKSEILPKAKDLVETHVLLRSHIVPSLDIKSLLAIALKQNTLILLLPWLTKYLSLLDFVTLRLPYYQDIHKILFEIYHNHSEQKMVSYNGLMIQFSLGWLFELPHFPENEYFSFCSTFNKNSIVEKQPKNGYKTRHKGQQQCIDNLNIIDQNTLYLCCPYLEEIKKLLSDNATSNNKVAVKHITPVTAVEANSEIVKRKTEQQLEDAFFNGQPGSLRKTVEFVSERVASSTVKFFCHALVPRGKEKAITELRKMLQAIQEEIQSFSGDDDQFKTLLKEKSIHLAQNELTCLISSCNQEMLRIAQEKIPPAIDSLISLDALSQTKEFCVNVTTKMYVERVRQWISGHVNLTLFSKDFDQEVQKTVLGKRTEKDKLAFALPSGGRNLKHNEECLSGFYVLSKIKDIVCDIIQNSSNVSDENILIILEETLKSITQRNDINDALLSNICSVMFDLCVLLVVHRPLFLTQLRIETLTKIWVQHPKVENLFKNILSPRNVRMIQSSKNKEESWSNFAKILVYLLENKFLSMEEFESQCTGFFRQDWTSGVLEQYSNFLKKIRYFFDKNDESDEKFGLMLDFLSDFCSEL